MEKLSSKKFVIALLILTATTILSVTGNMTGDVSNIFMGVGMAYLAGQSAVDFNQK